MYILKRILPRVRKLSNGIRYIKKMGQSNTFARVKTGVHIAYPARFTLTTVFNRDVLMGYGSIGLNSTP